MKPANITVTISGYSMPSPNQPIKGPALLFGTQPTGKTYIISKEVTIVLGDMEQKVFKHQVTDDATQMWYYTWLDGELVTLTGAEVLEIRARDGQDWGDFGRLI